VVAPTPPPVVVAPTPPLPPRAVSPPARPASTNRLVSMDLIDEDEWLDALERRIDRLSPLPGSYVPIAVGGRPSGR
jgi:hypothetical protein